MIRISVGRCIAYACSLVCALGVCALSFLCFIKSSDIIFSHHFMDVADSILCVLVCEYGKQVRYEVGAKCSPGTNSKVTVFSVRYVQVGWVLLDGLN